MEISSAMIRHYLDYVSSYVGDNDGVVPENINEYYKDTIQMKLAATHHNDLDILRLAIDYLITSPKVDAASFADIHYLYEPDEIMELLFYIRSVVWPNLPPPDYEEVKDIVLVEISTSDWWDRRKAEGKHW